MWTKQPQTELPGSSSSRESEFPGAPLGATAPIRPSSPTARKLAVLGSTLKINGDISGDEDLQIDGKVEGPIALQGQKLIAGRSAQLHSEITAREVVVYGKIHGNVRAQDRVEIKKDGSVLGDITTSRISIEDGAYFKGRIEIERSKAPVVEETETELTPVPVTAG